MMCLKTVLDMTVPMIVWSDELWVCSINPQNDVVIFYLFQFAFYVSWTCNIGAPGLLCVATRLSLQLPLFPVRGTLHDGYLYGCLPIACACLIILIIPIFDAAQLLSFLILLSVSTPPFVSQCIETR